MRLTQCTVQWMALVNMVMNNRITGKVEGFIE
jgi:hypothetical protein